MRLRQLAAAHRTPVRAERRRQLGERRPHAARGVEEHHRARFGRQAREPPGPLAGPAGREPLEAEPFARQSGDGEGRRHRGRPRQRGHRDVRRGRGRGQPVAGVADTGQAGVGDQQHIPAGAQLGEQFGGPARLHRVVVGDHPGVQVDAERAGQPAQPTGVLRGDDVRGGQVRDESGRCVVDPTDGDGGDGQRTCAVGRGCWYRRSRCRGARSRLAGAAPAVPFSPSAAPASCCHVRTSTHVR